MSDFGLTKFKDDVQKHNNDMQGSIHWTAPEILSESPDVDLTLADVYSFGKSFLPQSVCMYGQTIHCSLVIIKGIILLLQENNPIWE